MTVALQKHKNQLYEDFVTFAKSHLESWDIDPTYPLLKNYYKIMDFDDEQALWFTHLFMTFYNTGSAEKLFQRHKRPEYIMEPVRDLVYNLERRSIRGKSASEVYLNPALDVITKHGSHILFWVYKTVEKSDDPRERWTLLRKEYEKIRWNGGWASYKWCDLLKYVHGFDGSIYPEITAPDVGLGGGGITTGPIPTLALLTGNTTKYVASDFKFQLSEYDHILKQGLKYKGLEQFETALCDFYSLYKGRYYVGHDIDFQMEELHKSNSSEAMWKSRKLSFKPQYLGEEHMWAGVRDDMKTVYRDIGVVINTCR